MVFFQVVSGQISALFGAASSSAPSNGTSSTFSAGQVGPAMQMFYQALNQPPVQSSLVPNIFGVLGSAVELVREAALGTPNPAVVGLPNTVPVMSAPMGSYYYPSNMGLPVAYTSNYAVVPMTSSYPQVTYTSNPTFYSMPSPYTGSWSG